MKLVHYTYIYMYPVKSTCAGWIFKINFLGVPLEKIFLYNFNSLSYNNSFYSQLYYIYYSTLQIPDQLNTHLMNIQSLSFSQIETKNQKNLFCIFHLFLRVKSPPFNLHQQLRDTPYIQCFMSLTISYLHGCTYMLWND